MGRQRVHHHDPWRFPSAPRPPSRWRCRNTTTDLETGNDYPSGDERISPLDEEELSRSERGQQRFHEAAQLEACNDMVASPHPRLVRPGRSH